MQSVLNSVLEGGFQESIRRTTFFGIKILDWLPFKPKKLAGGRATNTRQNLEKAMRRLEMKEERDDFFGHLLKPDYKGPEITPLFISATSNALLLAGSETTGTFLQGE